MARAVAFDHTGTKLCRPDISVPAQAARLTRMTKTCLTKKQITKPAEQSQAAGGLPVATYAADTFLQYCIHTHPVREDP